MRDEGRVRKNFPHPSSLFPHPSFSSLIPLPSSLFSSLIPLPSSLFPSPIPLPSSLFPLPTLFTVSARKKQPISIRPGRKGAVQIGP